MTLWSFSFAQKNPTPFDPSNGRLVFFPSCVSTRFEDLCAQKEEKWDPLRKTKRFSYFWVISYTHSWDWPDLSQLEAISPRPPAESNHKFRRGSLRAVRVRVCTQGPREPVSLSSLERVPLQLTNTRRRTFSRLRLLLASGWTHQGEAEISQFSLGGRLSPVPTLGRHSTPGSWEAECGAYVWGWKEPYPETSHPVLSLTDSRCSARMQLMWTNAQTYFPSPTYRCTTSSKAQKWRSETKQETLIFSDTLRWA